MPVPPQPCPKGPFEAGNRRFVASAPVAIIGQQSRIGWTDLRSCSKSSGKADVPRGRICTTPVIENSEPNFRKGCWDFLPLSKRKWAGGNPLSGLKVESPMRSCRSDIADLFKRSAVLTVVKTAPRRLRRWPLASLDHRCARRNGCCTGRDGETAPSRTEKHRRSYRSNNDEVMDSQMLFMKRLPGQNVDRTQSASLGGCMSVRGACLQHRGWRVHASDRVYVKRHNGHDSDRAEHPPQVRAVLRSQRRRHLRSL